MAPPALSILYATEADLQAYISVPGEVGRLDDDGTGVIDGPEPGYLTSILNYATARCNLYLLKLYAATDLANDWMVNRWAIAIALNELSCRRGNPPPGSTKDLYDAAIKDLIDVSNQVIHLDIGLRISMFPAWSNMRVSQWNTLRKLVVERAISDSSTGGTAAQQPAATRDVVADYLFDWR